LKETIDLKSMKVRY